MKVVFQVRSRWATQVGRPLQLAAAPPSPEARTASRWYQPAPTQRSPSRRSSVTSASNENRKAGTGTLSATRGGPSDSPTEARVSSRRSASRRKRTPPTSRNPAGVDPVGLAAVELQRQGGGADPEAGLDEGLDGAGRPGRRLQRGGQHDERSWRADRGGRAGAGRCLLGRRRGRQGGRRGRSQDGGQVPGRLAHGLQRGLVGEPAEQGADVGESLGLRLGGQVAPLPGGVPGVVEQRHGDLEVDLERLRLALEPLPAEVGHLRRHHRREGRSRGPLAPGHRATAEGLPEGPERRLARDHAERQLEDVDAVGTGPGGPRSLEDQPVSSGAGDDEDLPVERRRLGRRGALVEEGGLVGADGGAPGEQERRGEEDQPGTRHGAPRRGARPGARGS